MYTFVLVHRKDGSLDFIIRVAQRNIRRYRSRKEGGGGASLCSRGKSEHHWARTRGEYGRPMVGIHVHNDAARKFISNVAGEQRIKASHDRRNIFAHTFFPSRLYNPKRAERTKGKKRKRREKQQRKNEEEEKRHVHRHHHPLPPPCNGHLRGDG